MQNEHFFNIASEFYDDMISFEKSSPNRLKFYDSFLDKNKKKVADFGCGTGIDSICLSKLGFDVTGYDISEEMINKAIQNAEKHRTKTQFYKIDLTEDIALKNKFDYVLSMGNTIANLPGVKLPQLFNNIKSLLNNNGNFIFQIVNYNKILEEKKRVLGITEDDNKIYIRFYDFLDFHINFNILTVSKNNLKENTLITTSLYPHTHERITSLLINAGFKKIEYFSGFNKSITDFSASDDIIYTAEI